MNNSYSDLSCKLTKFIDKDEKKTQGIYFTPPITVSRNIKILTPYLKDVKNILEPSCGSCEFVSYLSKLNSSFKITAIEKNNLIFQHIKVISNENINIINKDYLEYSHVLQNKNIKFDLIIGNPPFFVMKSKDVDTQFNNFYDGRPNIFILFIILSLKLLNNNGILSFILPKNFLNCIYYDKTRQLINNNYKIIDISECEDNYLETKQDTILMIIQKRNDNCFNNEPYVLKNQFTIFGTLSNISKLKNLYNGSTTLKSLDFNVSVGTVVWNQHKDKLTNDNSKTLLIYSSDIKNNKLEIQNYSNPQKKNYIDKPGLNKPILVVNRGYGKGNYNFEYCIINEPVEYLIENHLMCIKFNKEIDNDKLIELYHKVISSLKNNKTKQFINIYFGNSAINTKELAEIIPIYL